jgi:CheY-like chemotaxis protein
MQRNAEQSIKNDLCVALPPSRLCVYSIAFGIILDDTFNCRGRVMTTWMLVEDEPDLHDMLTTMIEGIGHTVLGFIDGESALIWLRSIELENPASELPELAVIDIRLPGKISGTEVAARLRESKTLSHIVIVLMTAYRLSPEEETAVLQRAAPDMMLYKPLPSFPVFRQKLEELLM